MFCGGKNHQTSIPWRACTLFGFNKCWWVSEWVGEYEQKDLTSETSNKLTWESGLGTGKEEGLSVYTLLFRFFRWLHATLWSLFWKQSRCFKSMLKWEQEHKGTSKIKDANLWLTPLSQHLGKERETHLRMKVIRTSWGHRDHARGPSQPNPGAGWALKVKIEDGILRSLLWYVLRA